MEYAAGLQGDSFRSISLGRKTIEVRVPRSADSKWLKMRAGDSLTFTDRDTGEVLEVEVRAIRHYATVRALLEAEGVANVTTGGRDLEQMIEHIESFEGYKEAIPKFGVLAIELQRKDAPTNVIK